MIDPADGASAKQAGASQWCTLRVGCGSNQRPAGRRPAVWWEKSPIHSSIILRRSGRTFDRTQQVEAAREPIGNRSSSWRRVFAFVAMGTKRPEFPDRTILNARSAPLRPRRHCDGNPRNFRTGDPFFNVLFLRIFDQECRRQP